MGTHPIFESDFDCLTEMRVSRILAANRSQSPFNVWLTQWLGGRTAPGEHYQRYTYEQSARTYPARIKPPGENERLHTVAYIYRDERLVRRPALASSGRLTPRSPTCAATP